MELFKKFTCIVLYIYIYILTLIMYDVKVY